MEEIDDDELEEPIQPDIVSAVGCVPFGLFYFELREKEFIIFFMIIIHYYYDMLLLLLLLL